MMNIRGQLRRLIERAAHRKRLSLVEEVQKYKQSLLLQDAGGGAFPINVSVIIPTFYKEKEELSGYRYEVIRQELSVLGQLITKGVIDEIIIVDGSRTPRGEPDENLIRQIITSAYRIIPLFHDQVDLLNKFQVLKDRAKLGIYDFVFKVIHQLDENIIKTSKKAKINISRVPAGKGAALWLATATSSGDLLVYLDSDIRNLEEWQVASLILPILKSYKIQRGVEFVKAYYDRLAVNLDSPDKGFYQLGGRVTRLFMIPFLKVLTRRGVLRGSEKLRYPLSGEFAAKRRFIESIGFPGDYGIETGMLLEIWKRKMFSKVTQADLHLYQHFPRDDKSVTNMVVQIVTLLLSELSSLTKIDEKIVDSYLQEAYRELERTYTFYDKIEVKMDVSQKVRRTFYKDMKRDEKRIKEYAQILGNLIKTKRALQKDLIKLPPWTNLVNTLEGRNFQNYLRRRTSTYTFQLLNKQGLTSYD